MDAPGFALHWYDIVGMVGSALVIGAFYLLQAGRLSGTGATYQLLNFFGAGGVLVSLLGAFNPGVFVLEVTWMAISLYGMWRTVKLRRKPKPSS